MTASALLAAMSSLLSLLLLTAAVGRTSARRYPLLAQSGHAAITTQVPQVANCHFLSAIGGKECPLLAQSGHPLGSLKAYEVPYAASAVCLSVSDFQSGADFTFASTVTRTVLISGGGIAGPTMAFWLKAAGFQPTLIEQAPAPRRGGYVIDFWGLGYDIAERMGLIEEINRAGYHIRDMRIVDAKGKRISGFGTSVFLELTGGRYVTVGRSALSQLLLKKGSRDIEAIFGDEITEIDDQQTHVRVRFKSGAERRFDFVVGADGLHSGVRRLVFGPQDRFEKRLGYVVTAFEATGYRPRNEDVYVMYNEPGRMVGRVSLRDDKTLFLFVFAEDADTPIHDLPAQKRLVRSKFGRSGWECRSILDSLDDAPEVYFDRVSQIRMEHWSCGRVALVGDAAYCVSLLAGQGSALAMTGAYILAGELAKAAGQHDIAFANYEKLLRDFVEKKQRGAERFASAFAPKTRLGLFFRNQVIRAAAIPGFARLTFGRDIIDMLQLPDYQWPPDLVGHNLSRARR